jgi:hypothetical protein
MLDHPAILAKKGEEPFLLPRNKPGVNPRGDPSSGIVALDFRKGFGEITGKVQDDGMVGVITGGIEGVAIQQAPPAPSDG